MHRSYCKSKFKFRLSFFDSSNIYCDKNTKIRLRRTNFTSLENTVRSIYKCEHKSLESFIVGLFYKLVISGKTLHYI